MASESDRGRVRLAELVAALSLGIDLGFGQPMEHVLRQCLIALRLAERIGLDEESRAVVYYTALLVNVGCHSDAHEQAKWFGDDIALKSGKYDHELTSPRAAAAAMRRLGSGNPPLHRFRVGLEFALSGRKEVDEMMAHHAAIARSLGDQLGLPSRSPRRSARPTSSGMGADGPTGSRARPCRSPRGSRNWASTSRSRTGSEGSRRRRRSRASAAGSSSTRRSPRSSARRGTCSSQTSIRSGPGTP